MLKKIEQDFKKALQERDQERISLLRMLKSALHNAEIELRPEKKELNDEEAIKVIKREVKKRKEAIELYKKGERPDLAAKEEKEMAILETYLPKQLSEKELGKIIKETIKELDASGPADFGKIMGAVMKKAAGQADGSLVSKLVKEELL